MFSGSMPMLNPAPKRAPLRPGEGPHPRPVAGRYGSIACMPFIIRLMTTCCNSHAGEHGRQIACEVELQSDAMAWISRGSG